MTVESRGLVRWRRVGLHFGLTLALTGGATLGWRYAHGGWQGPRAMVFLNLTMLVPGLVALVLQRFVFGEPIRETLALRWPKPRWLLTAWLLAPALMLLALAIGVLLPGTSFASDMAGVGALGLSREQIVATRARLPEAVPLALGVLLMQGLLVGPTACLLGGLGEELGWRGFLHTELKPLGFRAQSALVGLLWGIWHLPATLQGYAYPQHPFVGSLLLLGLTQILAPIYGRLRDRSGSVLVPAVFHGTCSASGLVALSFVNGGGELLTGFTGAAGLIAGVCVGAPFLAMTRGERERVELGRPDVGLQPQPPSLGPRS